eukprot:g4824.t1
MGLRQMPYVLQMASMSLLAIFAQGQDLQDCDVVASPFTVGSTEDASTLATSLRCSSGTFDVQWVGGVFVSETIHVTNGTSLSITGAGSSAAIADGGNVTQLFVVDRGSTLRFSDMTLAHGNASFGGAINAFEASVSFSGSMSFISNSAVDDGGAIFANSSSIFWDGDGTQFVSNFAGDDGGAIGAHGASNVSWNGYGTQFVSNSAGDDAGAIYTWESTLSWDGDGTQFISNSANDVAGALAAFGSTVSVNADGTNFSSNSAASGGVILVAESSAVFWEGDGTQFISNIANYTGGAIYVAESSNVSWGGDFTEFRNNSAGNVGGAVLSDESSISWDGDGTLFSSNYAGEDGGAIFLDDYSAMSWGGDHTLFSFNYAVAYGGAIAVGDYSTLSWDGGGSQFISNHANVSGGAIYVLAEDDDQSDVIWNGNDTEFTNNSARYDGGAIRLLYYARMFWYGNGAIFSSNSAGDDGGAITVGDSSGLIWNGDGAIFTSNSAGDDGGAIRVDRSSGMFLRGDDIHFHANFAGGDGGAIEVWGTSVLSSSGNATFSRNVARGNGGAIAAVEGYWDTADFDGGTFIENSARYGGALYCTSSDFNFTRVTFKSNSASDGGGAIALAWLLDAEYPTSRLSPSICTKCNFSDNISKTGGAVETLAGELELTSCLFEGNSAGNELFCSAGSYRKDTEQEGPTARYETVCLDCPDWDECLGCSIARGNVVPTCEAPLEHTEAKENGSTLETLSIAGGYWRASNDSDKIMACYNADACIGGLTGAEDYCAQGYTGPYCAACEADYSPSLSFTCTRCSSSRRQGLMAVTVIAAVVIACVVVAIVRYLVSTRPEEERSAGCFHRRILRAIPLQALKIAVVVWQILIQFADASGVTYPGAYQDFLSAVDVVNFDLGYVLSAGCLWSNMDFHDRLLVNTLGPLVVVGLLGITYLVAMHRSRALGGDAVVDKIRYRHQTVLLLVTFLIYSSVSSTVFQTFACEKLDDGGDYLRADYNIQCTDAKHKSFELYAGIMIFVYPVGIPLLYAILLFQRRDVLAKAGADKTKARSISSLWEPYRPERFYYEVVECGRRIMLTGVVVFIFPNDAAQIAITMLSAFFFLAIFEMLRPYESGSDMWMCRGGHVIVFLSMFYLLLLKVDVSGERSESQDVYGGLLVAAHVLMILAIVVEVAIICRASRRKQVEEEPGSSPASPPQLRMRAGSDETPYFESVPPLWKSLSGQASVSATTGPTRSVDGSVPAVGRP